MAVTNKLAIPPQQKPSDESFDVRPKAVEEWLHALPVANLGETSRRLYQALREVNRLQVPAQRRAEFLEELRETLHYVHEGLRRHYLNRDFPLPEKNRRIAQLAIALLNEMALGYQIVLEFGGRGLRGLSRRQRGLALHRAIRYLGALLLEGFLIYEPSPRGIWQRLHTLYLIARDEGLDEFGVRDTDLAPEVEKSTTADAYKQILLTAATGPFRMQQGEAAKIYDLMERLAPAAELLDPVSEEAASTIFHVDLSADTGPVPAFRDENPRGHRHLALQTDDLLALLDKGVDGRARGWRRRRDPLDVDDATRERVTLALGQEPRRRHSRLAAASQVQVVLGLSQIHRALVKQLGQDLEQSPADDGRHFNSKDIEGASGNGRDIWDLIYHPAPALLPKEQTFNAFRTDEHRETAVTAGRWRLVNVSAGGYCLFSDPKQTAGARVGEVLALRERDAKDVPWQTGVIRWMRHTPTEGLHLGVQVVAPRPKPVLIQLEEQDETRPRIDRGLLLPEVRPTGQPATLITPPLRYAVDHRMLVSSHGSAQAVHLTRELDSTRSFSQFVFRPTGDPMDGEDPFDSVFASI